jgi:hypothetical protein
MINVALGSYVEVVLQNSVALNGVCEQHSWHLHGFHVALIGRGVGTFRPGIDNASFTLNASQVLYKDSFTVFPMMADPHAQESFPFMGTPGSGCGWQALRFRADHAGTWLMHCHIVWHGMMGMGVVFHVRDANGAPLPALPADAAICGDTSVLYRDVNNMRTLLPSVFGPADAVGPSSCSDDDSSAAWAHVVVPLLVIALVVAVIVACIQRHRRCTGKSAPLSQRMRGGADEFAEGGDINELPSSHPPPRVGSVAVDADFLSGHEGHADGRFAAAVAAAAATSPTSNAQVARGGARHDKRDARRAAASPASSSSSSSGRRGARGDGGGSGSSSGSESRRTARSASSPHEVAMLSPEAQGFSDDHEEL